jgi:hypothetical protein
LVISSIFFKEKILISLVFFIIFYSLSKPSPGSSNHSADSRVPKWFQSYKFLVLSICYLLPTIYFYDPCFNCFPYSWLSWIRLSKLSTDMKDFFLNQAFRNKSYNGWEELQCT